MQCDLCTDKVVCATPLHMKIVHGCKLEKTGCRKEGRVWKHGENCSVFWCPKHESRKVFGDAGSFVVHTQKEHKCSCKIINPSRGHEKLCPCYKQCPIKKGCVVVQGSVRNHVKTEHGIMIIARSAKNGGGLVI